MSDLCGLCESSSDAPYLCFIADMEFSNEEPFIGDSEEQLRACVDCAHALSGHSVVSPEDEEFRLVLEHVDFQSVKGRVVEVVRGMQCGHCAGPIGDNPDDNFSFAQRTLRLNPDLLTDSEVTAKWVCADCADSCRDCDH